MRNAGWLLMTMLGVAPAAAQDVPKDAQIAQAVMAAPEDRRAGAAVLGFVGGSIVPLRPGTNDLVCLADNPAVEGFSVACYHKDLEPFMARGREMTAQGITDDKVRDQTRYDEEVKAGKLSMPKEPRTLYVMTGKSVDAGPGDGRRGLHALGDLRAVRDGRDHGPADEAGRPGVPVADGPGHGGRAHHDQPASTVGQGPPRP